MKHILAVILIVLLISGCSAADSDGTFRFFYPRVEYTQNTEDSVIAEEKREILDISSTDDILNLYVQGPENPQLRNPFPSGLKVVSVYIMGDTVYITVSDSLSTLSSIDLVLACSSLGQTAIRITGAQTAQISCENAKVEGMNYFTVSAETIFYLDPVPTETDSPTTE